MGNFTQQELAAMYEYQQSEKGKAEMAVKKAFLKEVHERAGVFVPFQEVGIMKNCQTGETRYFMKG